MTTRLGKPRHRFPTMVSLIILCIALVFPLQATASTHNALIYGYRCTGSTNNSASSTNKASPFYIYNLYNLLGSFTTQAIKSGYYNSSLGEFPNRVYALYMCRFDTDAQSCSTCVNEAKNQILKACPFQTEAIIWYENCMLHYSQSSFFGKLIISPWLLLSKPQNISKNHIADFTEIMRKSMKKLANSTAYNSKSPVKMFQTTVVNVTGVGELFELALCFPDLSHSDCFRCLSIAIDRLVISVDSRVLLPTCAVWYQTSPFSTSSANTTYPFYNSSSVSEQTLAGKSFFFSGSIIAKTINTYSYVSLSFHTFSYSYLDTCFIFGVK